MRVIGTLVPSGGGGDTEAPTVPQNLVATSVNAGRVDLSWSASTDNVAVIGYQIFRNGSPLTTTIATSHSDTTCQPSTEYTYTVAAFDAAGNSSGGSDPSAATTPANAAPVWQAVPDQTLVVGDAYFLNLNTYCTDADEDTIAYGVVSGTLPTGLALVGQSISGTPTVSGQSRTVTVRATDPFAAIDTTIDYQTYDADVTAPPIPAGLAATTVSSSQIDVSWNASVDVAGSANELVTGTQDYRLYRSTDGTNFSLRTTTTSLSYSDTGLSSGTQYFYRIAVRDVELNESAQSSSVSATTTAAFVWVANQPSYEPIIDGLAGWGVETTAGSGRHLGTPSTSVINVDTLSTSATDGALISPASGNQPAYYRGSLRWAVERTFPRTIVFSVSGMYDMQRTQNIDSPYCTLAFQTAPSPGFYIKNGCFQVRGNDVLIWHMACYNGDEASGQGFNVRRGFTFGSGLASKPARCVVAWSSMYWSEDELIAGSQGGTDLTIAHSVIAEALAWPDHAEWPHAFGGSFDIVNRVCMTRNLIAHCKARSMLSRITNFAMCNNIIYNAKGASNIDPTNTGGQGVDLHATLGTPVATFTNLIGNYFIKGPNYSSQYGGDTPIFIRGSDDPNFPLAAGSRVYLSANTAHGWNFVTQADLATLSGTPVSGVLASARIDASWPDGLRGTVPTSAGFLTLAAATIGSRPLERAAGRDGIVWQHPQNRIAGSGDEGLIPETTAEVGGVFTVPTNTHDLFSSVDMAGDPLPLVDWLAPGANPNKTVGEEWLYRKHLLVAPA